MGHISCPICDHGSFADLTLFKECVGSALSRPMCCLVCQQVVHGLSSLHIHLSQHESETQSTVSRDTKLDIGLQTIRSVGTNSPLSDDCTQPDVCGENSIIGQRFKSLTEFKVQELPNNEAIPPLDKLDLQDSPLRFDLPQEAKEEESAIRKLVSSNSDGLRSPNECSVHSLTISAQTNSPPASSQYSCDECGLMFSSQHFLAWHKDIIHKHSDYFEVSCKLCKAKFPSLDAYRNHVRENHSEQRYMCEKCPKTFKLRGSLVVHKRMYHDGSPSVCQLCHKKFPSDARRDFHERRHHSSCGKTTTKGKFSQDVEVNMAAKKTFQNSIGGACKNLGDLIQKNASHSKFTENLVPSSTSLMKNTSPALFVPSAGFSDKTLSVHIGTHSIAGKGSIFEGRMDGRKSEEMLDQQPQTAQLQDKTGRLSCVSHSEKQSSKSSVSLIDMQLPGLSQNVKTGAEKPPSLKTFPDEGLYKIFHQTEHKTTNENLQNLPEIAAEGMNAASNPNCPEKRAGDQSSNIASSSYLTKSLNDENVGSSPGCSNAVFIPLMNGNKEEFSGKIKDSSVGHATSLGKILKKPENTSPCNVSAEKAAERTLGNDLPSTDIQIAAAESSNLKEMKKDFSKNHQNQKVGLPAFLGCDGKSWECDVCKKCFTTKYFLKKHKRLHTGETPYMCSECGKTFTFQQSYHKHLLYHSDEKPHSCSYCGRAFKEMSTLHNHVRIHTGEKPFVCETCGKAFRQRVSYLVHQRIHTGVLPYTCQDCHKCFRYKVSLRSHKCEKTSKASPPVPTNSPSKEILNEVDDFSSRNTQASNANFEKILGTNELNISETQVQFQKPNNVSDAALSALMKRSYLSQQVDLDSSPGLHMDDNSYRTQSVCDATQASFSAPNFAANERSNDSSNNSTNISSNTSGIFPYANNCNVRNNVCENRDNQCPQNVSPAHTLKPTSTHTQGVENTIQLSWKNKISADDNVRTGLNNQDPIQTSFSSNNEILAESKKDVGTSQKNVADDYYNFTHIPNLFNEDEREERYMDINFSNTKELLGNLPLAESEEMPEYPTMLTLSSHTSDSEDEMDGEAVFRRLFS